MSDTREIHVTLTFACQVEGDATPTEVGQALCRRVELPQIGCPRWIATPTTVGFISAQEAHD